MTLSKRAIRPAQTSLLQSRGLLPISLDYRLCPEINLIDGPMTDVRDAYAWVQNGGLQDAVRDEDILIDTDAIVVIGWSTGGHLAMTTAWTTKKISLKPPRAVLAFYSPVDFESGGEYSFQPLNLWISVWNPPKTRDADVLAQTSTCGARKCTQNAASPWTVSSPPSPPPDP